MSDDELLTKIRTLRAAYMAATHLFDGSPPAEVESAFTSKLRAVVLDWRPLGDVITRREVIRTPKQSRARFTDPVLAYMKANPGATSKQIKLATGLDNDAFHYAITALRGRIRREDNNRGRPSGEMHRYYLIEAKEEGA